MFTKVVSLGSFCQCAHQIRRHFAVQEAGYFDWLISPIDGLVKTLDSDFTINFHRDNIRIKPDGDGAVDIATGIVYLHHFGEDSRAISEQAIEEHYPSQREKFDFLAQRWLKMTAEDRILFVLQADMSVSDASRIRDVLAKKCANEFRLVIVGNPSHDMTVDDPLIHADRVAPAGTDHPNPWTGDDANWSAALARATERFGPYLGS